MTAGSPALGDGAPVRAAPRLAFRPDLQGLRAVAILLVVLAHSGVPLFAGGFVGVDVFFVLSGYLITGVLLREFEQTGRIALLRFYARRLKRLLPALAAMVTVSVGLAYWLLSPFEARVQLASATYASTWTSNLYFFFNELDYFDEIAARDLFLHTWSLGVEEQFYLLWPLLLLAIFLAGPVRRLAGDARTRVIIFGVITVTSFAFSLVLSARWPTAAFYLMPSRIWQFSLGAMVYVAFPSDGVDYATRRGMRIPTPGGPLALLIVGLTLILGSAIGLHSEMAYPGVWALAPSLGAALSIMAGYGLSAGHGGLLAHNAMVWLGDRSYSWYLWHWPVLILGFSFGFESQPMPIFGLVLLSLLLAILSYRWIELPFWRGFLSRAESARVILLSALAMVALGALSFHSDRQLANNVAATNHSFSWRSDFPDIYRMPCDAWYHHSRVEPCIFGSDEAPKTVLLLGDSIGAQWFSAIPAIFEPPEWRTVVLTKSACAIVDVEYFYPRIGGPYEICTEWRNAVLDHIEEDRPDVIIIGNAASYNFAEQDWIDGSKRVLDRLSRVASSVLVIPGTPALTFDGPGCVARNIDPNGQLDRNACKSSGGLDGPERVGDYLRTAADPFPNVHVMDLTDVVCPAGYCSATNEDSVVIFRDSQHLTDSFVRGSTPLIRERIRDLLAGDE